MTELIGIVLQRILTITLNVLISLRSFSFKKKRNMKKLREIPIWYVSSNTIGARNDSLSEGSFMQVMFGVTILVLDWVIL